MYTHTYTHTHNKIQPDPVAARSKAWFCCGWLPGIAGWNPAGSMDFCLL